MISILTIIRIVIISTNDDGGTRTSSFRGWLMLSRYFPVSMRILCHNHSLSLLPDEAGLAHLRAKMLPKSVLMSARAYSWRASARPAPPMAP